MVCSMRVAAGIAAVLWQLLFTSASAVRVGDGDAINDGQHDSRALQVSGPRVESRILEVFESAKKMVVASHAPAMIMQDHPHSMIAVDDSRKETAGRQEVLASHQAAGTCPVNLENQHVLLSWMTWDFPQGVLVSVVFWGSFLLLTWACPLWSRELKEQAADRLMATLHAIISAVFGAIALLGTKPMCKVGDCWMHGAVQFTLGFFIIDFCSMIVCDIWKKWRPIDAEILGHHALLMVTFAAGCYYDFLLWVYAVLLINEASTPFIHVLWLLIRAELKGTVGFIILGCTFTLVFCLCRIVMIPYIYYQMMTIDFCPIYGQHRVWVINSGFTLMYALNWLWFGKLLQGALKVLRNDKPVVVNKVVSSSSSSESVGKENSRRASRCSFYGQS